MQSIRIQHVDEMRALGRRLGAVSSPDTVIALSGDLGAGKTVVAQGMGEGLGVTSVVASPTFVLVALHESGRLPFVHADLYRLGDADEALAIGLPELLAGGAVAAVEWADRFPEVLPADRLDVHIALVSGEPEARVVTLTARGPRHQDLEDLAGG